MKDLYRHLLITINVFNFTILIINDAGSILEIYICIGNVKISISKIYVLTIARAGFKNHKYQKEHKPTHITNHL
ncbi:hypothetical protein [Nonlabens sp. YIK11]|uniref:hypothetical protein n=1 Tax=Nonlabens sp. YIK11 TaxID=1453349 RepID=UPI0012E2D39A|nr:hypothetical protein [Nonlabens sp. YIK11]